MSVDERTVLHIARLARIALADDQVATVASDLNKILAWVEQLNRADISGVPPLTSVVAQHLKMRDDLVSEGGDAEGLMSNAPEAEDKFFVVPKVVE